MNNKDIQIQELQARIAVQHQFIIDVVGHYMAIAHGEPEETLLGYIHENGGKAMDGGLQKGFVPVSVVTEIFESLKTLQAFYKNHIMWKTLKMEAFLTRIQNIIKLYS